jgi:predicted DNA-binding transcriptional regulator AlpA
MGDQRCGANVMRTLKDTLLAGASLNGEQHETAPRLALHVGEASKLAGISRAFLYAEWKAGRGPPRIKLGSRTLVLHEDLLAWLRSHHVTAGAELTDDHRLEPPRASIEDQPSDRKQIKRVRLCELAGQLATGDIR